MLIRGRRLGLGVFPASCHEKHILLRAEASRNKGKKKLTEHTKMDYAVTSAEKPEDILKGHTWDRMYRSYYGNRYDGKVEIKIEEILSKKKGGFPTT